MPFLRRPLAAIADAFALMVDARPRLAAIEELTRTSDAALVARGTTREREIRRIVGVSAHI